MAGEWIKMRMDLENDPAVYKIASKTMLDRLSVVGRLYAFWAWADKHAVDGRVDGATSTVVDDVAHLDGFADALVAVGWLEIGNDCVQIPKHERHNGESAKERGLKNARQAKWRRNKDADVSTDVDATSSTGASTREEKRRDSAKAGGAPPDPVKVAFDLGVELLCPDQTEKNARAIVGMIRKHFGDEETVEMLDSARGRSLPVPWLMKVHAVALVMDSISKSCGGAEVRRLQDGRYQCGQQYFDREGKKQVAI